MPDIFIADKTRDKEGTLHEPHPITSVVEKEEGHTHNPLSAFIMHPENLRFEGQDGEEKIILLLRKHPITNVPWIVGATLMILAPLLLRSFPLLDFLPPNFQTVSILIWYLITAAFILEEFLSWFFNVYIVTDERIIDVDFLNLIYKEVSDTNIDKIQDVTLRVGSFIRTIFNYGDVIIQTAAEIPQFEFLAVPNPTRVVKVLQELRVEEEQEKIEGRVR